MSEPLKRCTRCKEERPFGMFNKCSRSKDGKQTWCKLCKSDHWTETQPRKPHLAQPIPEGMKRCGRCRETKALAEFYRVSLRVTGRGGYKDGRDYTCKQCSIQKATERAKEMRRAPEPKRRVELKFCPKCQESKPRACFSTDRRNVDWLSGMCRECYQAENVRLGKRTYNRDYHYEVKYGLRRGELARMLEAQQGNCALCDGTLEPKATPGAEMKPYVDHSHTSGKVRALLCRTCNFAIGFLEMEKPGWRERALAYLERHNEVS